MQAAVLPVTVSKTSAGAAHAAGALALDPAKPEDPVTSDAAFTQALAGLMGVTAGRHGTWRQPRPAAGRRRRQASARPATKARLAAKPTPPARQRR